MKNWLKRSVCWDTPEGMHLVSQRLPAAGPNKARQDKHFVLLSLPSLSLPSSTSVPAMQTPQNRWEGPCNGSDCWLLYSTTQVRLDQQRKNSDDKLKLVEVLVIITFYNIESVDTVWTLVLQQSDD